MLKAVTTQAAIAMTIAACSACDRTPTSTSKGPITAAERSAMGGLLLYVSEQDEHSSIVYQQTASGRGKAPLTDGDGAAFPYGLAAKGPRAGQLALVINDDIFVSKAGRLEPLFQSAGKDWYPRFSPDGRWVLFESSKDAYRELYKLDLSAPAGTEPVRLTNDRAGNFDGAWSPDGRSIIFSSSRYGQLDLMLMNADGGDLARLTRHPGDSIKPAFSPANNGQVAFISARDGRDDLFDLRLNGQTALDNKNLTKGAPLGRSRVTRFAWRPDGGAIALSVSAPKTRSKIFVVELSTGKVRRLSGEDQSDSDPAWSLDGRYLAFTRSQGRGRSAVFLMRADGSGQVQLSSAQDGQRVWLPRFVEAPVGKGATE